ncbi:MAG: MBL fold metallo-hydrolase [Oligoflexia bacterium]|nr:MBL fold metallo-hydrolase [Oligoflexia bacterium]
MLLLPLQIKTQIKKMQNKITILGTGTSTGVPTIGCNCQVCTSKDKRNHRLRTSVHLESSDGISILVDTSPDLRYQVLRSSIKKVDAVILTHEHADHLHGIDDLRPFCFAKTPKSSINVIPIYTTKKVSEELTIRFPYIFQANKIFDLNHPQIGGGIPHLNLINIDTDTDQPELLLDEILGEKFTFFISPHGYTHTISFIHSKLGYFVDIACIEEKTLETLKNANLDILIIDCLREKKHQTHLNLDTALSYAEYINAKFTGLIHLAHNLEHQSLTDLLMSRYGCDKKILPLEDGQILYYS